MSIVQMINGHLNKLVEARTYGVTDYKDLDVEVRDSFSLITEPLKLKAQGWNVVLKSPALIRFFNTHNLHQEDVDVMQQVLLLDARSIEEIEEALITGNVTLQKKQMYSQVYVDFANNYSAYGYSYSRRMDFELYLFVDIINYFKRNQIGWEEQKISEITDKLTSLLDKRDELNAYNSSLSFDERMGFIKYRLMYAHSNVLVSPVEHYMKKKEYFDLCEELYKLTVQKEGWSRSNYIEAARYIQRCSNSENNPEQVRGWFAQILKHPKGVEWLKHIFFDEYGEGYTINEHEIRRLSEAAHDDERSVYEVIYGSGSDMANLLSIRSGSNTVVRKQVKDWFKGKKKGIIRLFTTNPSVYMNASQYSILFTDEFQSVVNVNTLNKHNLNMLLKESSVHELREHVRENVPLTYNEFDYVYKETDKLNRQVFYNLVDAGLPIDQRLRAVKELPKLTKVFKGIFTEEETVRKATDLLLQKPLKVWIENHEIQLLLHATIKHKLFVLLAPEIYNKFKQDIRFVTDLDFMMRNYKLMALVPNLNEAKALFIQENKEALEMFDKLGLSTEFLEMYRDNIIYFLDRNLGHVYLKLAKSSALSEEQKHNLRLITKAELANKLDEIKFADEDFELEIGLPLTNLQKAGWKSNTQMKVAKTKKFLVSETYDYETTIRIGENPVTSCLHWNNGQYSRCLLSLFDTNKKILVAKDDKGRIMARAALRLTKGSMDERVYLLKNEQKFMNKALAFKDIEGDMQKIKTQKDEQVQEELVLFLENMYSSLDFEEQSFVKEAFIQLAEQKAAELGARLVMSTDYQYNLASEEYLNETYNVFISYSKNGYQYLDSLTGQATESLEGSYRPAQVLMCKSEEKVAVNQ